MKKDPGGSFLFGYHESTKTEMRLAQALKKAGVPFEAESPLGHYRVDFLCGEWLVVEVDGESHLAREKVQDDKKRQKDLEDLGFTVIRISSSDLTREESAKRWAKRIKEMLRKGPGGGSSEETGNPYIKSQVERVREELRKKAAAEGTRVTEEKARAALRPTSFERREKRQDIPETMEDYFGGKSDDFKSMVQRFGFGKSPTKDEGLDSIGRFEKRTRRPGRRK